MEMPCFRFMGASFPFHNTILSFATGALSCLLPSEGVVKKSFYKKMNRTKFFSFYTLQKRYANSSSRSQKLVPYPPRLTRAFAAEARHGHGRGARRFIETAAPLLALIRWSGWPVSKIAEKKPSGRYKSMNKGEPARFHAFSPIFLHYFPGKPNVLRGTLGFPLVF